MTIVRRAIALALLPLAAIGAAAPVTGEPSAAPTAEAPSAARVAALIDERRATEARAMAESLIAELAARGAGESVEAADLFDLILRAASLGPLTVEDARTLADRAVGLRERLHDPDDPALAGTLYRAGYAYRWAGAYDTARPLRVDSAGIVGPNMISGNSILDNTLNGAAIVSGSVRFNGNTVGGNFLDGLKVSGERVLVESNFFEGNGGAGVRLLNGTGHAYRSNFVRGNAGGDILDQFGNTDGGGNIK